jgi:2,3-bisphosphoglycerate-dependent phosphoglycerate mutase
MPELEDGLMQLYYIRHAQSENNALWLDTGSSEGRSADPDLTETGRLQAKALTRYLKHHRRPQPGPEAGHDPQNVEGFAFSHLYCSLMVRAVETGTYLADALGLPLVAWPEFHEVGGIHQLGAEGEERIGLPGNNRAYFEEHYPNLILPESLGEEGWWNRPYEQPAERPGRARRVLRELLARHGDSDARVAVISHGGFYNHLLRILLDLPEEGGIWFSLNNAAMTRIDFEDEAATWVEYANRLMFNDPALIT